VTVARNEEQMVRERIAESFEPVSAERSADRVRALVRTRRPKRRAGRAAAFAAVASAAAVLAAVGLGYWAVGRPAPSHVPSVMPVPQPPNQSPPEPSEEEVYAQRGTKRAGLQDAAGHLTFRPVLPLPVAGRGDLIDIYTFSERDGLQKDEGLDSALVARYPAFLRVTEKQWDPKYVHDEASFQALVLDPYGPEIRAMASTVTISGVAVVSMPVRGPRRSRLGEEHPPPGGFVSWYRGGVGYMLWSSSHTEDQLVEMARTMIEWAPPSSNRPD